MNKLKYDDPIGMKICRKCKICKPLNRTHYSVLNNAYDKFNNICKACDCKRSSERHYSKASHNIHKTCSTCKKYFFVTRKHLNHGKRRGKEYGKYCSHSCFLMSNKSSTFRKGSSWNGKRRGVNNPMVKYSEGTIKSIKLLLKDNIRNKDIANQLKVNPSTVSSIKHGHSWSHVNV